jgi:hypothetical protein
VDGRIRPASGRALQNRDAEHRQQFRAQQFEATSLICGDKIEQAASSKSRLVASTRACRLSELVALIRAHVRQPAAKAAGHFRLGEWCGGRKFCRGPRRPFDSRIRASASELPHGTLDDRISAKIDGALPIAHDSEADERAPELVVGSARRRSITHLPPAHAPEASARAGHRTFTPRWA